TFTTIFASEALANLTSLQKATDLQGKLEQLIQSALPSLAPPFITAPVVSSTTEDSATVAWTTNIKTYGSLRYATDAEYLANKNDYTTEVADGQTTATDHTVTLTNLTPNTLYHLQARAYVFPQVVGTTQDMEFMTKAAPITASIVAIKNDGFTVAWKTDQPTTSIVEYQNLKTGESNLVTDAIRNTYHSVDVKNLPSGTPYSVTVSGVNTSGNRLDAASVLHVTTSVDVTPPIISNFKVDNALVPGRTGFIQTVVGWTTDKLANSTVYYEEGAGAATTTKLLANKVESLDTYTTSHIMILPSLKAGTVYRIEVVSTDQSGNTKSFGPTSIITPNQTQSVLDIIVKNFEDTFKFLGAKQ
ncbi:MAG TPA: fibronectin type III domain-containing protein, partial [Candidatus Paceibacterota bacterium]|nr:fibronectin type III domain-containing protein [Candidatus Paceibacterota bacterium]